MIYSSVALACFLGLLAALVGTVLLTTPQPKDIRSCIIAKMYNVSLCPTDKSYVKLSGISPYIRHAVIVSEDASFYDHKGLDLHELKLSFEENLREGRFARGGSTITQQLAKNVYLSGEKSLFRKAREALIAIQLEETLKKDEILEKYLNVVEFGPDVYGVRKATRYYFSKEPHEVGVLEAAWLAFVLPNPAKYSQSYRRRELTKFARSQLRVIIERMARFRKISQEDADLALAQLDQIFKPIEDPDDQWLNEDNPSQSIEPTMPEPSEAEPQPEVLPDEPTETTNEASEDDAELKEPAEF